VDPGCARIHCGGNRLLLMDEIANLKPVVETARQV
jgi:hypothetical protein